MIDNTLAVAIGNWYVHEMIMINDLIWLKQSNAELKTHSIRNLSKIHWSLLVVLALLIKPIDPSSFPSSWQMVVARADVDKFVYLSVCVFEFGQWFPFTLIKIYRVNYTPPLIYF